MKIAVLGSGNGGAAVAFDCAIHGHEVRLFDFPQFPAMVGAVAAAGGIASEGDLEGFAEVAYSGHDIGQTLEGAELIYLVGPAYSTGPFAEACKPHLRKGQIVVVCPSSCAGSLEFKKVAGLDLEDESILVAETSTLPYAVRVLEPGKIRVFLKLKDGLFIAALPAKRTEEVLEAVRDVYPAYKAARNVLQTSLQNGNPVIHPAITLLNTALIERTAGNFCFYEDGVTPAVGRLVKAVDDERVAIGKALGVTVVPDPELGVMQGYMAEPTYDIGFSTAPGFKGIKAQDSLDYRYFNEDVGYGLIFMEQLGRQVAVATPFMTMIIEMVSLLMQRNYRAEATRTMEAYGLEKQTVAALEKILG